jgi:hypothetical protein
LRTLKSPAAKRTETPNIQSLEGAERKAVDTAFSDRLQRAQIDT